VAVQSYGVRKSEPPPWEPQKACTARSLLDSFPPAARSRARRRHTDTMDPPAGTPHIPISLTATLAQPLTRRAEQICGPRHQPLVVLVPGWPPRLPPTRAPRSPDVDAKNSRGKRPHLSRARNTNIFFSAAGKKKRKEFLRPPRSIAPRTFRAGKAFKSPPKPCPPCLLIHRPLPTSLPSNSELRGGVRRGCGARARKVFDGSPLQAGGWARRAAAAPCTS
jgi:hypothetical protein